MGILSLFSPTAVQRQPDTCTNCLKCSRVCPSGLPVHLGKRVFSPECSGCLDCVRACPSAGTLSLKTAGLGTLGWNASSLLLELPPDALPGGGRGVYGALQNDAVNPGQFVLVSEVRIEHRRFIAIIRKVGFGEDH